MLSTIECLIGIATIKSKSKLPTSISNIPTKDVETKEYVEPWLAIEKPIRQFKIKGEFILDETET